MTTPPFDADPNDAYFKVHQSVPSTDGPACVVFRRQPDGTHAPVVGLADAQFAQLLTSLGAIADGGGGGSTVIDAQILQIQTDTLAYLGQMLPAMVETSYAVSVTAMTRANVYHALTPQGAIDRSRLYSQRFDMYGNETWYMDNPNGTAGLISSKSETDTDIQLTAEGLVQSITYSRTLIGSNPAVTSTRTIVYSMWPPHWDMTDTGWQ